MGLAGRDARCGPGPHSRSPARRGPRRGRIYRLLLFRPDPTSQATNWTRKFLGSSLVLIFMSGGGENRAEFKNRKEKKKAPRSVTLGERGRAFRNPRAPGAVGPACRAWWGQVNSGVGPTAPRACGGCDASEHCERIPSATRPHLFSILIPAD